jgi:hypothetical protein
LPDHDAFYKFNEALNTEGEMKNVKSNMTILHSRFAEAKRLGDSVDQEESMGGSYDLIPVE